MASTKKTAAAGTIPVVKHKLIQIQQLGTRTRRELEDDVREAMAKGYKVYSFGRTAYGTVEIQMGITEEWSFQDFMTEIDELLARGAS